MLTFWLIAAVMILVGAGVVAIPLLRSAPSKEQRSGDQTNVLVYQDHLAELNADVESGILSADQFEQGRLELERRLLEETSSRPDKKQGKNPPRNHAWLAVVVGLCIPGLSLAIYAQLGRIDLLGESPRSAMPDAPHASSDMAMEQTLKALADRLEAEPNDPKGWMMLARSYTTLKNYQKAGEVYQRVLGLIGDNPDVLVAYADARLMASNGRIDVETKALIDRALKVDPNNLNALWMAGTVTYQEGNYAKTLGIWESIAKQAPEGSELAQTMATNIAEARALLQGTQAP
jgi:cytochrome c-type biogenesis protein CcmH